MTSSAADRAASEADARRIPFDVAARLIESLVSIGDHYADLMDRRQAVMAVLMQELGADSGCWAWGHGNPADNSIVAVAMIDVGLSDVQRSHLQQLGFDAELFQQHYIRVFREINGIPKSKSLLEEDFFDPDGTQRPRLREFFRGCGWCSWLQNARYFPENAFSSVNFFRNLGRPPFERFEADLLELVVSNVSWMHAHIGNTLPPEQLKRLTERQRTVLAMLMDGLSRKLIARRLGISEDTVGDHLTAIFAAFEVSSAIELASKFLRNQ